MHTYGKPDMTLTPELTYTLLLATQALHLLHHRLARRHISFAEVLTGFVLCIPPAAALAPAGLLMAAHLGLAAVQLIGSLFIHRLSPDWAPAQTAR